ncbi:F0F1 ATP synthase subunit epsilon [Candidatus Entotheonella palauensis]|uniref:F0F1 ATP synthase subunit epsilon n=1 Tax=Candidatus Entotheonella palauensis TaxID=93172 RepID=UPI000B7E2EF2|nr:F0F1 ATP synthase subunit epsilon [Candidatus Entotheonella palauensis]
MPLDVEIVTPDRIILQAQVDELNVPSDWGYIGILPGHTPLLTILGQGELMYRQNTAQHYMSLFWGYMEVNDDKVIILAEVAEPDAEIDRARAESARDRAEDRLRRIHESDIDFERARGALMRAMIRLQASSHAM